MPNKLTLENHNNLQNLCTNPKVPRNKIYKHNPQKLTACAHAKIQWRKRIERKQPSNMYWQHKVQCTIKVFNIAPITFISNSNNFPTSSAAFPMFHRAHKIRIRHICIAIWSDHHYFWTPTRLRPAASFKGFALQKRPIWEALWNEASLGTLLRISIPSQG